MTPIRLRRLFVATTIFLSSAVLSCGAYVGYLQLSGNFHEVVAGKLYRSAQPSAGQLQAYIKDHGIRTVINLRGTNPQQEWYRNELSTSQALGVKHIDFGISASKYVPPEKAAALIEIMAKAEKPILIHCESGADRSGLASASVFHISLPPMRWIAVLKTTKPLIVERRQRLRLVKSSGRQQRSVSSMH